MMNWAGELIVRKIISVVLILFSLPFPCIAADGISVSAKAAVLYDPLCDAVLWGKNEQLVLGMASTTKIMTAIVAMELFNTEDIVEIQAEWCGIEGSSMYLKEGEQLTVKDLLYGLLLASGNDAATALAGLYTGDPADFVAYMNKTAILLGLSDTQFQNSSGLSQEGHYTTALDLARLAAYAMQQPLFAEIVATKTYICGDRQITNHNKLLDQINACGIKTGYTKADGRCLVSAKEQDGRLLIAVTLSAPDDWNDHKVMFESGFSSLSPATPIEAGSIVSIPVVGSDTTEVAVYCTQTYTEKLDKALHDQVTVHIIGPRFVYAEQAKGGKPYGKVQVRYRDKVLYEDTLYYANSVETKQEKITVWQRFFTWICCLLE